MLLEVIVGLLRDPALPVKLLFVFREDYLAKLSRLFQRCPELPEQHMRLTPPASEKLESEQFGSRKTHGCDVHSNQLAHSPSGPDVP